MMKNLQNIPDKIKKFKKIKFIKLDLGSENEKIINVLKTKSSKGRFNYLCCWWFIWS